MVLLVDNAFREFFAAAWDQACVEIDQYARKKPNPHSPELFDDQGNARWITIGSEMGADGKKHGGHPVKISGDGTMLTGHFAGQKIDQAFGDKPAQEDRPKPDYGKRLEALQQRRDPDGIESAKTPPEAPPSFNRTAGDVVSEIRRKGMEFEGKLQQERRTNPFATHGKDYENAYYEMRDLMYEANDNGGYTEAEKGMIRNAFSSYWPIPDGAEEKAENNDDDDQDLDQFRPVPAKKKGKSPVSSPVEPPVESPIEPPKLLTNEDAKPGDQLGLFGEADKSPTPKPKIDGDPKAKQGALFDTDGATGQMDLFDADPGTPEDLVWKGQDDKPKENPISPGGTPEPPANEQPKPPVPPKPKKPFVYPNGMVQAFDAEGKPIAAPKSESIQSTDPSTANKTEKEPDPSPVEQASQSFDKAIEKGDSPREAAAAATKALDADYEFARKSTVANAGEDLKGSARHKVNFWRSLEDAERNGTAKELVTRDQLLKNEPHELMVHTDRNPLTSLAMHFALRSFPAKPGTKQASNDKKDREQFLDAYRSVKSKAEELAKTKDSGNVVDAIDDLRDHVASLIKKYRGQKADGLMGQASATDKYNQTANDLVGLYRALDTGWRATKTGVSGRLREFANLAKERYGESAESLENLAEHVKDVMEGHSLNKTFGKESKKTRRFDPSEVYVKVANRKGGRDVSEVTSDPNKATRHLVGQMGFRGVQWGNYVSDEERKHHAAKVVEAMVDLADVTGLHPKDIALDGKLGLAIGARGTGNASAHYEPGTNVINLTRASGVGALAHEWGHAFDHMLNDFGFKSDTNRRGDERKRGDYMSADLDTHQVTVNQALPGRPAWTTTTSNPERFNDQKSYTVTERPKSEIRSAFRAWWKASSKFRDRLKDQLRKDVRDKLISQQKANDYWNSQHEIFARTFERHVQHKLETSDRQNTYLSGLGGSHEYWPTREEAGEMAPAFDAIFAAFRKQKHGSEDVVKYSQAELLEAAYRVAGTEDLFFDIARYRSECRVFLERYRQQPTIDRYEWNESQHPRQPSGSPRGIGGEFAGARTSGASATRTSLPGGTNSAPILNTKQRELPERPQISANHPLHWRQIPDGTLMLGTMDFAKGVRNLMAEAQRQVGPQANEETVWARVDKQRLQNLLDSMNRMDKEAMAKGIKLHEFVNASGLIPQSIAERLHGGSRFFDPTLLRGKFNQPDVSQQPKATFADQIGANKPKPEAESETTRQSKGEPKPKKTAAQSRLDNQLTDVIRKHLGSDDETMIDEFKSFHSEAHKQLTDEANDINQMIREITGTAKNLKESKQGFNKLGSGGGLLANPMETGKLMARARQGLLDPSREKGFDELVDYAKTHYPHLVGKSEDRGGAEQGLVELLAGGFRVPPSRLSDEVMERATTLAGPSFFEALANGGQAPVPDDGTDWESVPFSSEAFNRIWNMVIVERYAHRSNPNHVSVPTPAQREAGNYRKAHIQFQGLDIAIETPKGRRRRPEWPPMPAHYGYIKRTEGNDGDNLDVFVGPDRSSELVFVVDQPKASSGFDEHKCLIGFRSLKEATECYRAAYTPGWKVGPVTTMTIDQFKAWVKSGDLRRPVSVQVSKYAQAAMLPASMS